jgi:hypothetical protein
MHRTSDLRWQLFQCDPHHLDAMAPALMAFSKQPVMLTHIAPIYRQWGITYYRRQPGAAHSRGKRQNGAHRLMEIKGNHNVYRCF